MPSYLVFDKRFVWDLPDTTGTIFWLDKNTSFIAPWQLSQDAIVPINGSPVASGETLQLVYGQEYVADTQAYVGVLRYEGTDSNGLKLNGYLIAPPPDGIQTRPMGLVKRASTSHGQVMFHWLRNADTLQLSLMWDQLSAEQVGTLMAAFLNTPDKPELLELGGRSFFLAGMPDISVDGTQGRFSVELSGMVNTYYVGGGVS